MDLPQIVIVIGLALFLLGLLEAFMFEDAMKGTVGIMGGAALIAIGLHFAH